MTMDNDSPDKPVIMVADDDESLQDILAKYLAGKQMRLIQAADGEKALELLIMERPDLVLLDVMMPKLSGWEVLKYIREREVYRNTGVILFSGMGAKTNEMNAGLYNADDYINKPFEFSELEFKMRKVLSHIRQRKKDEEQVTKPE